MYLTHNNIKCYIFGGVGGFPYPTISNDELLDYLKKGKRLECPDNCSPEM